MINELQKVSKALEKFNVKTISWHRKYIPIPRISKNNPFVLQFRKCLILRYLIMILFNNSNVGLFPFVSLAPIFTPTTLIPSDYIIIGCPSTG